MGIAYCLIRTSPENIEVLRDRPKAVAEFVYQDPDVYEEPKSSFLSKLFGNKAQTDDGPVPKRLEGDEEDIDKSWHIVHYLLCGDAGRGDGPLAIIGDDLNPLADINLGLGKPNIISADWVKEFAELASHMTDESFLERYVPEEMPLNELYMGDVVARGDVGDIREYALENFQFLRDFASEAAENGQAIITYYT
ncbi:YfbM family protein [uncultured Erythrobacter sp.]|uniref:YfbM family protein n=1 Tax=uncultured Erythrobacter sp. TaxID=263913 RepID=UPI002622C072|nr:YfbM family protein [uncultured Erythrobacter sp.]